ncbi:macro domain-containing protein [Elusimicrobiota bacterium]
MDNKSNNLSVKVDNTVVEVKTGDITLQDTDAIVNAANNQLSPGGGVSCAIHRAAGDELWKESRALGGCSTGDAKITSGYNLKAKYVIHTVGPVYSGVPEDSRLLEASYRSCLNLAAEKKIRSISFPAISTGIFGYPLEEAASIAIATIMDFIKDDSEIGQVSMVLHSNESFEIHKKAVEECLL